MENMQKELGRNLTLNHDRLCELMRDYELAQLGYDVQEQQFKDIYNRVLGENEFYSCMDCDTIKKGDRITSEDFSFLLSEEDWSRYMEMAKPYCIAQGLTDKDDRYVTNWLEIKMQRKNELIDFIIDTITPTAMRIIFDRMRRNVVYQDKLLAIIKEAFIN